MRGAAATLALSVAVTLLGGCVRHPDSGAMAPCCGYYGDPYGYYGDPYGYRRPAPHDPYGRPSDAYGAPPAAQPEAYPGPAAGAGTPLQASPLELHFAAANVTNDGRLTRLQAEEGMPLVARNFDAIDHGGKGFVTLAEIRAFMAQRRDAGGPSDRFDLN
jgi:hypothetical protein